MTKSQVTDAVEALQRLTNLLAGSRRPYGYVIATCLPLDNALENALRVLEQYEAIVATQPVQDKPSCISQEAEIGRQPATPAPQGDWVMVPREPTEAMYAAARGLLESKGMDTAMSEIYRTLLASAPAAPDPVDEEREDAVWKMLTLAANTAERVCREHADPTAGASAAKAIRALRARKP